MMMMMHSEQDMYVREIDAVTVECSLCLMLQQYDVDKDGTLDLLVCTTNGQLVFVDALGKLMNIHQVSRL